MKIEIKIPTLADLCAYCFGSGEVRAMQNVALFGGGSVRGSDTTMKCTYCNGTGQNE